MQMSGEKFANARSFRDYRTCTRWFPNSAGVVKPVLPDSVAQLCRRRQTGRFPGSEAARHGADVFIAHFLQALGRERGPAASAPTADKHFVLVGEIFFY